MRQKVNLQAVDRDALIEILKESDLEEKFNTGKLICPSTGQVITWENLGLLRVENGEIVLYSAEADLTNNN